MDKVDTFQIQLNLSDRELIYDYVAKEELHRPTSEAWNPAMFKGRGSINSIPKDDENDLMRIKLMDNMIMDGCFMEKKVKPKADSASADEVPSEKYSEKGSDFLFNNLDNEDDELPVRLIPVYHQGEVVRGTVLLKLKEPIAAKDLTISCVGQSVMNRRNYHKHGYYDDTRHEKYMEEEIVLWKKASDNGSSASKMSDTFNLMSLSGEPAVSSELAVGEHKFYFEFVLPRDAPQSVPPMYISTVNYAHLVWRLKAKIGTEGIFKRNVSCHKAILVEDVLDIARNQELLHSISAEESLDTGLLWSSGNIFCKVSLAKAGHVKGKPVPATIEVHNNSTSDLNKVTAYVNLHGKATQKMIWNLKINLKSTKVRGEPIKAGTNETYRWVLPWDFSESSADGRLLPVGHLEESSMFDVKYDVVVKIQRKGLHRNLEVNVPLEVGNLNSAEEDDAPPPYSSLM